MKYFITIFFVISSFIIYSQNNKKVFENGDYFYLNGQFDSASFYYSKVLSTDSLHSNCAYKLGLCYVKMPQKIWKAIPSFEIAIKSISLKYKDGPYKDRTAPADAYYYLGFAYQITMQSEKAIEYYNKYIELVKDTTKLISDVRQRIKCCLNATEFFDNPRPVQIYNVGHNINTSKSEFNPCVSDNDSVMYFTTEIFVTDEDGNVDKQYRIFRSFRYEEQGEDKWEEAEDITDQMQAENQCYTISTSADGKTLLLFKDFDVYEGNVFNEYGTLFLTRRVGGRWSTFEKVSCPEEDWGLITHASLSRNGNTIYFVSNMNKATSGFDIFYAYRKGKGVWSKAINIGNTINTPYDENTPFIVNDSILFFSSLGHNTMGGYDIFKSILKPNGEWTTPENLSIPVNSPADDMCFHPVSGGKQAYYSVERPDGYITFGRKDIFKIILEEEETASYDSIVATPTDSVALEIDTLANINTIASDQNEIKTQTSAPVVINEEIVPVTKDVKGLYEIQIFSSKYPMKYKQKFSNIEVREHVCKESYFRYTTGDYNTYTEAKADLPIVRSKGYSDAFIQKAQFYRDNAASIAPESGNAFYTVQILASFKKTDVSKAFPLLTNILEHKDTEGMFRYYCGNFNNWTDAKNELDRIKSLGYNGFIQNIAKFK